MKTTKNTNLILFPLSAIQMKTLRDVNKLLEKKDFYMLFNFKYCPRRKIRIQKIEFEKRKDLPRQANIGNFYAIYEWQYVEKMSEWLLYYENKQNWIDYLYKLLMEFMEKKNRVIFKLY